MSIINRFLLVFLFCIPSFLPNTALADYVPTKYYKLLYPNNGIYYTDHKLACNDFLLHYQTITTGRNYSIHNCTTTNVDIYSNPYNPDFYASATLSPWKDCGQGKVSWESSPSGLCPGSAPPPPPPPCQVGPAGIFGVLQPSGSSPQSPLSMLNRKSCSNGCETELSPYGADWYGSYLSTGYYVFGDNNFTGNSCTSGGSIPPPTSQPCPVCDCLKSGQSWGSVNGAVVCVPLASKGSEPVTKYTSSTTNNTTTNNTTNNTTTNNSTTNTNTTYGGDGSVTENKETTTTAADGTSTTTTDGKTDTKDNFCSTHPANPECRAKSLCEVSPDNPTCKDVCEKNPNLLICTQIDIDQLCKEHPSRMECLDAADYIGKSSDIPNDGVLGEKTVDVGGSLNWNPVPVATSSGCPAPRSVAIAGHTISINYDWICSYASAFYPLEMAAALLMAAAIVSAAVRGDAQPHQRSLF